MTREKRERARKRTNAFLDGNMAEKKQIEENQVGIYVSDRIVMGSLVGEGESVAILAITDGYQ